MAQPILYKGYNPTAPAKRTCRLFHLQIVRIELVTASGHRFRAGAGGLVIRSDYGGVALAQFGRRS